MSMVDITLTTMVSDGARYSAGSAEVAVSSERERCWWRCISGGEDQKKERMSVVEMEAR